MKSSGNAASTTTPRRRRATKRVSPVSICPVNGAGWCPYPFSPAQLERRLKMKAQAEAAKAEPSATGAKRKQEK